MKKLFYHLTGILFQIFSIIGIKNKKVLLFMGHNSGFKGNLKYIYDEMKRREKYHFVIISKKQLFTSEKKGIFAKGMEKLKKRVYFLFMLPFHLATSEYIFLNDNFLPLAYMHFKKNVKLIQLWHGAGAFKRFGLSTEKDPYVKACVKKGNQNITHMFVTSAGAVDIYKEALGIEKSRIYPLGMPVTDFYFNRGKLNAAVAFIQKKYPSVKGKKVILYAPTFRGTPEENEEILEYFNIRKILRALGSNYVILLRMHPQIRAGRECTDDRCIDVTDYPDVKELLAVSDLLITDYSSIVVEYALLKRPVIFYAYDLENYDRGFYFNYEQTVPGIIVKSLEELIFAIKNRTYDSSRMEEFLQKEYDIMDGEASKRVVDVVTGESNGL